MTPFALLQNIAQQCRSHAADLPSPSEAVLPGAVANAIIDPVGAA